MRQARFQWLRRWFPPSLAAPGRTEPPKKNEPVKRRLPIWNVAMPDGQLVTVEAMTKSEARARAKEKFLASLPPGTTVTVSNRTEAA